MYLDVENSVPGGVDFVELSQEGALWLEALCQMGNLVDHEVTDEFVGVSSACRAGNFMINTLRGLGTRAKSALAAGGGQEAIAHGMH
jgi:hypothetical protein